MKLKFLMPKNNLKTYVTLSMVVSMGLLSLILVIGLFGPESLLLKLSKDKSAVDLASIANQSEGNAVQATSQGSQSADQAAQQTDSQSQSTDSGSTTGDTTTTSSGTTTSSSGTQTGTGGSSTSGGSAASGGGSASGGSTTPTTPAGVAPTLTFSASPTTITSGSSTTLSWSINSTATAPVTCTAGSGWSGAQATSGSSSKSPTSTTSYTLTCTNSVGSSGTKTVSVTVSAPAVVCNAGGTCTSSDIAPHNSNGNCWVGVTGTGYNKVYVITSSFNSSHQSSAGKNAASATRTCGRVITINTLKGYTGQHSDGSKIGGSTFDSWMSSFYYANYQ